MLESWRTAFTEAPSRSTADLVDLLGENPFWTVSGVSRRLGIAYTTALRAVRSLEKAGILLPVGTARRDRVFCAKAILDVLEEPARLSPV